jgi:hypothetical protein
MKIYWITRMWNWVDLGDICMNFQNHAPNWHNFRFTWNQGKSTHKMLFCVVKCSHFAPSTNYGLRALENIKFTVKTCFKPNWITRLWDRVGLGDICTFFQNHALNRLNFKCYFVLESAYILPFKQIVIFDPQSIAYVNVKLGRYGWHLHVY